LSNTHLRKSEVVLQDLRRTLEKRSQYRTQFLIEISRLFPDIERSDEVEELGEKIIFAQIKDKILKSIPTSVSSEEKKLVENISEISEEKSTKKFNLVASNLNNNVTNFDKLATDLERRLKSAKEYKLESEKTRNLSILVNQVKNLSEILDSRLKIIMAYSEFNSDDYDEVLDNWEGHYNTLERQIGEISKKINIYSETSKDKGAKDFKNSTSSALKAITGKLSSCCKSFNVIRTEFENNSAESNEE